MFASCLGCFWLGPFWPQGVYSISTSVPICDVKLEPFLAGAIQTSTSSRGYSVIGAPCVSHEEPCMGKAGVTEEHPLICPAYTGHPAFTAKRAVRRQLDDCRNLCWFGVTISRKDASVTLQKVSSSW